MKPYNILFASIVVIADVKDAFPLEKTLSVMKEGIGTHFDPKRAPR